MKLFFPFLKKCSLLLISFCCSLAAIAQENEVDMADTMRSNGKIYVVVAVCLLILIGLFIYVMSVDRKLAKLEKEIKSEKR
jgi:hypothetical protein